MMMMTPPPPQVELQMELEEELALERVQELPVPPRSSFGDSVYFETL